MQLIYNYFKDLPFSSNKQNKNHFILAEVEKNSNKKFLPENSETKRENQFPKKKIK